MNFGGMYVAAITPFREVGYEADLGATLELVDYLCAAGVNGIALLGSTYGSTHRFVLGSPWQRALYRILPDGLRDRLELVTYYRLTPCRSRRCSGPQFPGLTRT